MWTSALMTQCQHVHTHCCGTLVTMATGLVKEVSGRRHDSAPCVISCVYQRRLPQYKIAPTYLE